MNIKDFKKIFKYGFNKEKISYNEALKGKSELRCFKCGNQAGYGYIYITENGQKKKRARVKCVKAKSHNETLIKYTTKFIDMEHDLMICQIERNCNTIKSENYTD